MNSKEDTNSSNAVNTAVNDMEDTYINAVNTAVNDMEDTYINAVNNTVVNDMEDTNSNSVNNTAVNDMEDTNSNPVNNTTVNEPDIMMALSNIDISYCTDDNNDVGVVKDNNSVDDCKIMMLNNYCLKHVFSFLSQKELIGVERVCKWWQSTSLDSWSTIKHVSVGEILSESRFRLRNSRLLYKISLDEILECILKRCGNYVKSLDIKQYGFFNGMKIIINMIAEYCTTLQHLNISCANIVRSDNCQSLFTHLEKLEMELLRTCDDDVIGFFNMCPNIRSLSIEHNQDFNASCFLTLNLETLEEFAIYDFRHSVKTLMPSFERMTNLKSLNLNSMYKSESLTSQKEFIQILGTFPNLEILNFQFDSHFTNSTLTPFTGISKKLLSLNVNGNYLINDLILKEIAASCLKLEHLNISKCRYVTGTGVSAVAKLPFLKKLCMSFLECVTDDHLEMFAGKGKLTQLEIKKCLQVTDIGCSKIIISCEDLEYLDISGCLRVTDATVKSADSAVKCRNNKKLIMLVGGTNVSKIKWKKTLLILDFSYSADWSSDSSVEYDNYYDNDSSGEDFFAEFDDYPCAANDYYVEKSPYNYYDYDGYYD